LRRFSISWSASSWVSPTRLKRSYSEPPLTATGFWLSSKETLENLGDPLLSPLKCLSIRDVSYLKVALQVDVHCFGFMNAIPVIMKPSVIETVQISLSMHQQGM
jgi:hypothetical protein